MDQPQPMYAAPPPAPPRKSGALRLVLIGCGIVTGLGVLACGGCLGFGYWMFTKLEEAPGQAGDAYLRAQPELEKEIGPITSTKRHFLGTTIHVVNDTGAASIAYTITTSKGTYSAVVWLEKKGGTWIAMGAEVDIAGRKWKVGTEVKMPASRGSSFDD